MGLAGFLLASSIHLTAAPLSFRVMTYNVCHPAEVQRNPELSKKFSWASRKAAICRHIVRENPDIIGFQEVRNVDDSSAVSDIWEWLGNHGYEVVSFRNNPSALAFINVIAYKQNKFFMDRTYRWWVSETPDYFSDTWGNGWGRVALMVSLYPIVVKRVGTQDIPYPDYARGAIHLVNIHHGLKHIERMHANQVLVEQIEKLVGRERYGMVIVTGDFNCFPDDGGCEELQILKDAGYHEALNNLITTGGVPVSGSFIGYSYDRFKCPPDRLGTQLDHIWYRALSPEWVVETTSHVSIARRDGYEITAKTEAELLTAPDGSSLRDMYCSDHAAGVANFGVLAFS